MRYHLDEQVDQAIAAALLRRGIDVTTSNAAGLLGSSDEQPLEFARQTGRVLFTHDADFLRLHALGVGHSGIVYAAPGSRDVGELVRFLCLLNDVLEPQQMQNAVEFV